MNQHDKIWSYLCEHGSITPMEAFLRLGITKLSTRIGEMIKAGFPILKDPVHYTDEDGNHVRYTRYYINQR